MNAVTDFIFLSSKSTVHADCSHEIKTCLLLVRKAITQLKKQRHHSANKGPYSQSYDFSTSHVQMWELNHKEGRGQRIDAFKLWCWKRLENPLDCREMIPVNPKESQPWIFIGRTDAEAPILWSPDVKSQLIGKDPDAGKDWRQEKEWQRPRWLNGITDSVDLILSKF